MNENLNHNLKNSILLHVDNDNTQQLMNKTYLLIPSFGFVFTACLHCLDMDGTLPLCQKTNPDASRTSQTKQ